MTKNPKLDSVVILTRGKQLYQTFPHAEAKILIGGLGLGRGRVNEQHIRFLREKKKTIKQTNNISTN